MLNEIPARLHADWNQSALIERENIPALRPYPWSDDRSIHRANATTSVDAGIGLMAIAPPVSPPSPGYHPRDDSPEPAYRSNEPGTSSASGQVLAPTAIKSTPPVPAQPRTSTPIGARPSSSPRANPDQATPRFASSDIRLRQPRESIDRNIESTRYNTRDRRQRRGNDDWN